MVWELEGALKYMQFQHPCHRQGQLSLDQVAQSQSNRSNCLILNSEFQQLKHNIKEIKIYKTNLFGCNQYLKLTWILIKLPKTKIEMVKQEVLTWKYVLCAPPATDFLYDFWTNFRIYKISFFSRTKTELILSFLQISAEGNPNILMKNPLEH